MSVLPTVFPVTCHTTHVGPGSTFVAIKGIKEDGITYIPEAVARGASRIVIEESVVLSSSIQELLTSKNIAPLRVANTRQALAELSAQALDYPARSLKIIGITGTVGKSTTVFLLEHVLKSAGYATARISSVTNSIKETLLPAPLTTPQPDYIQVFLDTCRRQNIEWIVMEVAAQALSLHRVDGIEFEAVIFTNFSREHGEFYPTLTDYFNAKKLILNQVKPGALVLLNNDDPHIAQLVCPQARVISYGLQATCSYWAQVNQADLNGLDLTVYNSNHEELPLICPASCGYFNGYNILAATSCALRLGIAPHAIQQACRTFAGVPGRLTRFVLPNGATAFIDYAYNPSSFQAVLSTLRQLSSHIIVVFGAGGDRDVPRRPLMGAVAAQYADSIILTSDNPRSEDPMAIIQNIQAGISPENNHTVLIELDREQAIRHAYKLSGSKSIIALLGKGPDEFQLVKGIKYHFSEAAILQSL